MSLKSENKRRFKNYLSLTKCFVEKNRFLEANYYFNKCIDIKRDSLALSELGMRIAIATYNGNMFVESFGDYCANGGSHAQAMVYESIYCYVICRPDLMEKVVRKIIVMNDVDLHMPMFCEVVVYSLIENFSYDFFCEFIDRFPQFLSLLSKDANKSLKRNIILVLLDLLRKIHA